MVRRLRLGRKRQPDQRLHHRPARRHHRLRPGRPGDLEVRRHQLRLDRRRQARVRRRHLVRDITDSVRRRPLSRAGRPSPTHMTRSAGSPPEAQAGSAPRTATTAPQAYSPVPAPAPGRPRRPSVDHRRTACPGHHRGHHEQASLNIHGDLVALRDVNATTVRWQARYNAFGAITATSGSSPGTEATGVSASRSRSATRSSTVDAAIDRHVRVA